MKASSPRPRKTQTRENLIGAAIASIRAKGYAATSVDDLCRATGVTKGAFFHHFASKEHLGVAAADSWSREAAELFSEAAFHHHADPVDRLLGYIDLRRAMIAGAPEDYSCFAGTVVQEVHASSEPLRASCGEVIYEHSAMLLPHIEAAMRKHGCEGGWTAASLALHIQAVLQGAFIIAKASAGTPPAIDCVDHLRRYVELLFATPKTGG